MNHRKRLFPASVLLLALTGVLVNAENWPQWRGPLFNGSTPETGLPDVWTKSNNIAWSAPLPGYSGSTPVVWNDRVFVSSPDESKNLVLICIDRATGKELWRSVVSEGDREKGRNNMASPSPVTDGKAVYAMFATGDLAAFDCSGALLWSRALGKEYGPFANMWIYGSSPLLFRNRLYIQVLQRNPVPADYPNASKEQTQRESFLLCVDAATGTNIWRTIRPTNATQESQEAYSTPIPLESNGETQILVVGANFLTANNAENGAEVWRCAGLNSRDESYWRIVPSPVAAGSIVVACSPKRDPVLGIRTGGKGDVTSTHLAWQLKDVPSDCCTPLYYQNKLFVLDGDRQVMACLEPGSGRKLWEGHLGTREIFRASPTGGDGKIYCISESGTVLILSAGPDFKLLRSIPMGEPPVRSSIAASGGQLFIRTGRNLHCVGVGTAGKSK